MYKKYILVHRFSVLELTNAPHQVRNTYNLLLTAPAIAMSLQFNTCFEKGAADIEIFCLSTVMYTA